MCRTFIIGGGSVARHEVAWFLFGSIPIRDANFKSLAWDYNTSIHMNKRDTVILTILAILGAIGMFAFLWAMYEMPEMDTYVSMFMMILSMLLMTISFAVLDEMARNKTK